jgi:hypothetical protein
MAPKEWNEGGRANEAEGRAIAIRTERSGISAQGTEVGQRQNVKVFSGLYGKECH